MKGFRRLLAAVAGHVRICWRHPFRCSAAQAPIHFADLNWESGSLITDILRIIVEKGYGLPTDTLPGTTITLETALANNDIQVIGEEWAGRSPVWVKAEAEGKVVSLGDTVKGATEGWWVPEYVIKGDPAKGIKPLAPDLRSVTRPAASTRTCSATRKPRARDASSTARSAGPRKWSTSRSSRPMG